MLNKLGLIKSIKYYYCLFSKSALKVTAGSTFSILLNIIFGVPQGSVFNPFFTYYQFYMQPLNDSIEFASYLY